MGNRKELVAYFSHVGENYGVGIIEKGNTQALAEIIARETGADLFRIEREIEYPKMYKDCINESKVERDKGIHPQLKQDISIDEYDIIYLGYPNWYGDMPMPVYTFLESHDFSNKTIIPFCTHGGSGLSSTAQTISRICKGNVLAGLEMHGTISQNDPAQAKEKVQSWLKSLKNYNI